MIEGGKILHIPYGGRPIDLKNGNYHTDLYEDHFRKYVMNRFVTIQRMEIILKKKFSTGDVDDMVRLYMCLLFNCFLFTNTHCNIYPGLQAH